MKKKILMVSVGPFYGGAEGYLVKLAQLLAPRFHVRAIVVDAEASRRLRGLHLEVIQLPSRAVSSTLGRYYFAALELRRQLSVFRPDFVHLNGQAECYLSAIPWLYRVPIVCTRHVPFNEHIRGIRRVLVRANLRLATKVICVSSLIRRQLSAIVSPEKLAVLPNWLDNIPKPGKSSRDSSEETFRLLFVGRIETIKGILDLIEAMQHVQNVSLDVVGSGSAMEAGRTAAAGLPIVFHGFQADCGPFFRGADLLVFPSHPDLEGQGQVPFEAMAHGLPCLISDIDVAMETADDGACAEVFPWGNCMELALKIKRLQTDSERLRELRKKGLARFLSTYTVDSIRDPYFHLFDQILLSGDR